jgi:hypothetical protein
MFNESSKILQTNANNTISCIYSKYQVSRLLEDWVNENSENYNFVISIRFDFLNKLNFKIEELLNNKINVMNTSPRLYISDNCVIANYELFLKYSKTYINLEKILINTDLKIYLDNIKCG